MELGRLLEGFPHAEDPNLLVGFESSDDAGVYRLGESLALVQTLDLITPVCDDPYAFGQVAAANALSDVYAMGGRPLTVMNICCFPATGVPEGVLSQILRGGYDKSLEAGATLVGGHTVRDPELKYGLSVTGTVDPERILTNGGARPGQILVLTKPIGTGVMIAAARKEAAPQADFQRVVTNMTRLNRRDSELALEHGATACTDVTGFGLVGHAVEVARASRVGIRLRASLVPRYEACAGLIDRGFTTAVTESNRTLAGSALEVDRSLTRTELSLLCDPQTSGGLLIALEAEAAPSLVEAARREGSPEASIVGEVFDSVEPRLQIAG